MTFAAAVKSLGMPRLSTRSFAEPRGIIPRGPIGFSNEPATALTMPFTVSPIVPSPPAAMMGEKPARAASSASAVIDPLRSETTTSKSTPTALSAAPASGQRAFEIQRLEYGFKITMAVIDPQPNDRSQFYLNSI